MSGVTGSVTISGYATGFTSVPEFPFGPVALIAVALPAMIILRAKYSAKLA